MQIRAAVIIAKCPVTNKLYGVRVEERGIGKWYATWAFAIKPEKAKREGWTEQLFPSKLLYDKNYPNCPYCKTFEDMSIR